MGRDRRQLEDYTADELATLPYFTGLLPLRKRAYLRLAAAALAASDEAIRTRLESWAALMTKRYGAEVKVWHNVVPWIPALLLVMWGEDPMQWPPVFSEGDAARADRWTRGKTPAYVVYLDADSEGGSAAIGVLTWPLLSPSRRKRGGVPRWLRGVKVLLTALTNFWENELIDHLFRARSYTAPTDHFIALYTAAPGEAGGGTEVSGGSYARVQVAAGFANWLGTNGETTDVDSAGTGGATSNRNAVTFPTPTASWGAISHMASLSASSGGNMYFYAQLTDPKNVNNGDPAPSFAVGDIDFTLA
jgi:hypothetical protein